MPEYLSLEKNYLDNAEQYAREHGLYDFTIVDCDSHYLATPWAEVATYVDQPYQRRILEAQPQTFQPRDLGDRTMEGRLKSYGLYMNHPMPPESRLPRAIWPIVEANRKMAIDYTIQFPTDLLTLGLHPDPDYETALAFAYARWTAEAILPHSNSIKAMLYLPFGDPDGCVELVRRYSDTPGVIGFMVTSTRRHPIYDNRYMPLYELLESKGMTLAFHTVSHWQDAPFLQLNRFLSAHALGFPFYNMIQLTNIVVNGIPERFPRLKLLFIEAGLAWLSFLMHRLDAEYMNRSADAPLLRHKPSHYMRQFYYTTQPMEVPEDMSQLESFFRLVGVDQILYASDYPHHDFDLPASIWDLPFLSTAEKKQVLGGNAERLFGDLLTRGNVAGRDY